MLTFNPFDYTPIQLKQDPKILLEQLRHESTFYPESEWRKRTIQMLEQLELPVLKEEEFYNFQNIGESTYLLIKEEVDVDWAETPQPLTKSVIYKIENGVIEQIEQKDGYGTHIIRGKVEYFKK